MKRVIAWLLECFRFDPTENCEYHTRRKPRNKLETKTILSVVSIIFIVGCSGTSVPIEPPNFEKRKAPVVQPIPVVTVERISQMEYYRCTGDWITASGTVTRTYSGNDETILTVESGMGRSGASYMIRNHFTAHTVYNATGWTQTQSRRDTLFGAQMDVIAQDNMVTFANGQYSSTHNPQTEECK